MGFETVVRPAVLPNIRPQPWRTQSVASAAMARTITDAPEGFAVIRGNPAKQLNLTTSTSISISRSLGQEIQRRVDGARIYQKNDDGSVNKDNFVDVEVANRLRTRDPKGTTTTYYKPIKPSDNIDILYNNKIIDTPYTG